MAGARFELFAFWRTSAAYRVRVALNLKGLAAHERFVDIDAGEHRSEAFLNINPLGAVPALVEPGHAPLTQSLAILEFLDEIAPEPPLLPADPYGRARVRSIALMLAADAHPLVTPRVKRYLTTVGGFDDAAWRAWQINWLTTGLDALERRLAAEAETGAYCHGDSITIADICLASIPAVMKIFKIPVAGVPTIERIVARCEENEAFAKADPFKQAGAPKS
ncbi:MAG: maleylacetoacetate isomerase [Methylocella sp.]